MTGAMTGGSQPTRSGLRFGKISAKESSEAESLQFYCDVLGMKLLRQKDYPNGQFTLAFVGYGDEANQLSSN